ncbi:LysR substrate-binding domain-containing protein [Burkholderia plantarii]|uniref:LysR substrate-binding domain-containing protein n=1 Tax=Burkholderia plantarii TaxID=41899 RepID=UPI00272C1B8A|nr:LysR substrate-binding domain-containing protein [Burkholderia plantarii]
MSASATAGPAPRCERSRSVAITEAVARNAADIGVVTRLPHDADVEMHAFGADELIVVVPGRHPLAGRRRVSFAETLDHEHVVPCSGTHLRFQMLGAASRAGRTPRGRVEAASRDASCAMVRAGAGIGILPRASAKACRPPATRLLALDEPWARRELAVGVRLADALSAAARLFLDHLRARADADRPS